MKNKKLIKVTASIALLLGLGTSVLTTTETVNASSSYRVKLVRNAYKYNGRGRRISRRLLRKGHIYRVYGTKFIKGKRYFILNRRTFIRTANGRKYTYRKKNVTKNKVLFRVNVTGVGDVYKQPGKYVTNESLSGKHAVYKEKEDSNGITWYQVGTNKWITSQDTDKPKSLNKESTTDNVESDKQGQTTSSSPSHQNNTSNYIDILKSQANQDFTNKVEEVFVNKLNNLRREKGLSELTIDPTLHDYAAMRGNECLQNFSHERPNGETNDYGECLVGGCLVNKDDTPEHVAEQAFKDFVYNDECSNWAHRDILLTSWCTRIGVGIGWDTTSDPYAVNYDLVVNIH